MSKEILNPMEVAQNLFAQSVLASIKEVGEDAQNKKYEQVAKAMEAFIDNEINFWIQVKAEWNALMSMEQKIDDTI
jgi:hypothetical protein